MSGEATRPLVIGIAGGSGSGKTTVLRKLVDRLGVEGITVLNHDSYYADFGDQDLMEVNFDHPHSLDTDLLIDHLDTLLSGAPADIPVYDFRRHARTKEVNRVFPSPVIFLDGILVMSDKRLRERMDIKIFVDAPDDIRLIRRIRRDMEERGRSVESILAQYERFVRPMHLEFIEPSRQFADVIIPRGGHNEIGIDMIAARARSILLASPS